MRLLLPFLLLAMIASAQNFDGNSAALLTGGKKLIVVTSPGWNDVNGTMTRYERHGNAWKKISEPIAIVVGKNGMAWDDHFTLRSPDSAGTIKHEGDGRSPAGVFRI